MEWTILHPNFYAGYEYFDHSQKIFINFEYTLSSDRTRFTLPIQ